MRRRIHGRHIPDRDNEPARRGSGSSQYQDLETAYNESAFHPPSNIQRQVEGRGRGLESGKTIVPNEWIQETAHKDELI